MTTATTEHPGGHVAWYALSARDVTAQLGVDPADGLDAHEAERRLEEYGPNELPAEPPPSVWEVGRAQLVNPMNIMLLIVVAASFVDRADRDGRGGAGAGDVQRGDGYGPGAEGAGQRGGAGQAAGAARPGAALGAGRADRIGHAGAGRHRAAGGRGRRPGGRADRVFGDAGAAGGRADRGERADTQGRGHAARRRGGPRRPDQPGVPEHPGDPWHRDDRGDGDRQRDRDGPDRRDGHRHPAVQVAAAARARRDDQGVRASIALAAVAIIAIFGLARGQTLDTLVLLCISTAIAAIPTGLPTFVQAMLSSGRAAAGRAQGGGQVARRTWRPWAGRPSSTATRPAR